MVAGEKGLIRFEDVYKYAFTGVNRGRLEDEEFNAIVNAIESVPKVDAVEVVRCKNCEYYKDVGCALVYGEYEPEPDDYCSYGKREDVGNGL